MPDSFIKRTMEKNGSLNEPLKPVPSMEDFSEDSEDNTHDSDCLSEGGNVVNCLRRRDFCAIARGVRLSFS
ncbi:unnamed protein product, partial [marine sediment metagenome]